MRERIPDPPDTSIAWCIQLFNSKPAPCLAHLRRHYPGSRIVLLADGNDGQLERYRETGQFFGAEVVVGDHLMARETCHLYVERLLRQALVGNEKFFFRIDPDTRLWRRFKWLPNFACAFGTLETTTVAFADRIRHPPNIQGGCIGVGREVADVVLESGILNYNACVENARSGWARTADCEYVLNQGGMLDDFLLSWAVDAAGFPILQHPEIGSYWRSPPKNDELHFAVTHPHKEMEAEG